MFLTEVPKVESASDFKTARFDARFPNANQTKNCWQNYVDFHKCLKIKVALDPSSRCCLISSLFHSFLISGRDVCSMQAVLDGVPLPLPDPMGDIVRVGLTSKVEQWDEQRAEGTFPYKGI